MKRKKHVHKVTLTEKRRQNKKRSDLMSKAISSDGLQSIFNTYYRGPLSALYRKIKEK
ncbi:MAG: hypothetical protein WBD04_04220 [Candidatus Omnitrophota bacterium]